MANGNRHGKPCPVAHCARGKIGMRADFAAAVLLDEEEASA